MKLISTICVSLLALLGACEKKSHAADNTTNPPPHNTPERDRTTGVPGTNDSEVANRVRQAIQNDTTLSSIANNIQVTAVNGTVTLRGTVKTQKDKDAAGAKAQGVSGVMSVDNQLTVSG